MLNHKQQRIQMQTVFGVVFVLLLSSGGFAQDTKPEHFGLTEEEIQEGGWVPLIKPENHKEGWIVQGLEFTGPKYNEEENALHFRGFDWWALITEKPYKDFTLRFEVQFDDREGKVTNSGILLRTPKEKIYEDQEHAFEIQLMDCFGKKPDAQISGAIFGAKAPSSNLIKKRGEWNAVEITLQGQKLLVKINGEVVQDVADVSKVEGAPKLRPEGHIAFQYRSETGRAMFRNMRIKPGAAVQKEKWISLFNGKDLDGWKVQKSDFAGPEVHGPTEGIVFKNYQEWAISTQENFKDAVIRFDFILNEADVNCGVLLRAPNDNPFSESARPLEILISDSHGKAPDTTVTGTVGGKVAPVANTMKPVGTINRMEVSLIGEKFTVLLNGDTVQQLDLSAHSELPHPSAGGPLTFVYHSSPGSMNLVNVEYLENVEARGGK